MNLFERKIEMPLQIIQMKAFFAEYTFPKQLITVSKLAEFAAVCKYCQGNLQNSKWNNITASEWQVSVNRLQVWLPVKIFKNG